MEVLGEQVEIRIAAHPAYLCVVRAAVRKLAEILGVAEETIDSVTLAMEEALANVIRHSYGGPCDRPIIVKVGRTALKEAAGVGLEVVIRDFGRAVDPATIKSRSLEDVRPGGLGVHIIHSVMDEVEYSCPLAGGMQLRMVKRIGQAPGDGVTRGGTCHGSANPGEKRLWRN